MIRLGVMSDSHGDPLAVRRCIAMAEDVDAWLHLGDLVSDAEILTRVSGKPVHAVRGNCDGYCAYDAEKVVCFEGARLLLVHGHRHGVDMYSAMTAAYRAEELFCDALLYGHTHVSTVEAWGKLLIVNPGSPRAPRLGRKPSFAIVTIDGRDVNARIITLDNTAR